jgi:hypothetical protein
MTLGTGATTANMSQLIRSSVWTDQLKEVLTDDMRIASSYVKWMNSEFSDGDTFNIPSIGQLSVFDYAEDTPIQFQSLDTGNFQFSITEYKGAGTYITQKARQDLHYAAALEAKFVPEQSRALTQEVENFIFKQGQPGTANGQTVADLNSYNGAAHRWVGMDTRNSQRCLSPEDFSRARYALKKANVPMTGLTAIVDPIQAAIIETHPNFVNYSDGVMSEMMQTGMSSGYRWVKRIFGFDVYESNYLPLCGSGQTGLSETIDSVASGTNAVANLFFANSGNCPPWIGAWRQMPKVDSGYDYKLQREEYVVTARYGAKLYYPENFVSVLTGTGSIW